MQLLANLCSEKHDKKLVGRNDIEDALKTLDKLTQEARMAVAEILKLTHVTNGTPSVLATRDLILNAYTSVSAFDTLLLRGAPAVYSTQVFKGNHVEVSPPFRFWSIIVLHPGRNEKRISHSQLSGTVVVCVELLFDVQACTWSKFSGR